MGTEVDEKDEDRQGKIDEGRKKIPEDITVEGGQEIPALVAAVIDQSENPTNLSQECLMKLKLQTGTVLSEIAALIESGPIDETDREPINEAVAFIENPTEDLLDIMKHTYSIGLVVSGYMMQGADVPPAIDAMNGYLLAFQCINRMSFVEREVREGDPNSSEVKDYISIALSEAITLSREYKGGNILSAVNELRSRLPMELQKKLDLQMERTNKALAARS